MIGWYVHHHGMGHLTRLQVVADHLRTPVVGLSSLPPPAGWEGRWVHLPRDDDPPAGTDDDRSAHGVLHHAPTHHRGLARRTAAISSWIERARPRLVVVDVSVEVALLARLCGIPVVVTALPGRRDDPAHRAAYDVADCLLAPWPEHAHGRDWPSHWAAKTVHVGGLSRFDDRRPPARSPRGPGAGRQVLLVWGAGGRTTDEAMVAQARAASGWSWTERSPHRPSSDLWAELCAADVVVTHAGQNAVAEVAAARAPAVVVAQHRPFDEQAATAAAVERLGVAEGLSEWPPAERWPELLARAVRRGGAGWSRWSPGDGARTAAAHLDRMAGR